MANLYQSTMWIVDTPSATPITRDPVRVRGVRWVGATTAGHLATITDAAGNVKWASACAAANFVEDDHFAAHPGTSPWIGLAVPTLGSGKLYVDLA